MASDPPVPDNTVVDHEPSGVTRGDPTPSGLREASLTIPLGGDGPPEPAALARIAAGRMGTPQPQPQPTSSQSLTSAADAMRNEEIDRKSVV